MIITLSPDVTFTGDGEGGEDDEEVHDTYKDDEDMGPGVHDTAFNKEPAVAPVNPQQDMMTMMKTMMEGFAGPLRDLVMVQAGNTSKRKREEEIEEEERVGTAILINQDNHNLRDDTHTVIDWEARSLRPYQGDLPLYWRK